jgi:hypothetical protein
MKFAYDTCGHTEETPCKDKEAYEEITRDENLILDL